VAQDDLFQASGDRPLAARLRPTAFAEFFGQSHLVGSTAAFRRAAEAGKLGSFILWGPPGVGKTTLAEIVARSADAAFEKVSAVSAGVADLRKIVELARRRKPQNTILFIDEIHRFSKSQQDAILPFVEDGTVVLIGATTENPSFEVNSALLSRARVYVLNALSDEEIRSVLDRGIADLRTVKFEPDAEEALIDLANGDARSALNMLELCAAIASAEALESVTLDTVESAIQRRAHVYDKSGDQHYDIISALHKSVRGSDVDASLYWLARMLESGEDPLYLARRIVRMASEDIGLADPHALTLSIAAQQAVHFIGMPEGALALAEAVAYLAAAPKSNALYKAYGAATKDVAGSRNDPVPLHLRNAPTKLMKQLDYGKGYKYAHDYEGGIIGQQNLPDRLAGREYYVPTDRGQERKIGERIAEWKRRTKPSAEEG
jgi:putative ATPase